ncbi:29135_t:CDS:1, partial [Gigaspora margarita]
LALGGLGAFPSKRDSAVSSGLEIGTRLNSYLHRYGPFRRQSLFLPKLYGF